MVGIDDYLITRYAGNKLLIRRNNSIQMKNKGEKNTFENPLPMQLCALGDFSKTMPSSDPCSQDDP
jgi:hypothetical protein